MTKEQEESMFIENKALIVKIINEHFVCDGPMVSKITTNWDDLFQWGSIGLLKAIRTYNPELGVPFGNWAACHIRYEIMYYTNPNSRKANRQQMLNDSLTSIHDIGRNDESINVGSDYDNLGTSKLVHLEDISYTDNVIRKLEIEDLKKSLTERDQYILQRLMDGCTQTDIGKELGISRQAVFERMQIIRRKCKIYVD